VLDAIQFRNGGQRYDVIMIFEIDEDDSAMTLKTATRGDRGADIVSLRWYDKDSRIMVDVPAYNSYDRIRIY